MAATSNSSVMGEDPMSIKVSLKVVAVLAGFGVAGLLGGFPAGHAANPPKPTISKDASAAIAQMGKSLSADQFSFQVRTLRVYADASGQPLHIAHSMKVTVHRPDKLRIEVTGDDGSTKLFYNGKTVVLFSVEGKRYTSLPVPNTIQGMLKEVMGRLRVDFPLADFLTDNPAKSFLFEVTSGREVNTVMIDGVPCRHFLFIQPPGIELELWLEKNDRSVPRRLIVTYRTLPDQPNFVAEFSDWDFSIHSTDAEFEFQAPEGAKQVELKPAAMAPSKRKERKQ
jgi:hypothetical protein